MDRFAASVATLTVVLVLLVALVGHLADPGAVRRALKAHRLLPLRLAGPVAAAAILAETGDPNRFATARALVKHAGLAPREKLSGSFIGRTKLSGQGRPGPGSGRCWPAWSCCS